MKEITINQALSLIKENKHRIFGSQFIKRTDGTVRSGSFSIAVKKNIKGSNGSGARYNPKKHGLLRVYDMKRGYRTIPLEGMFALNLNGNKYIIT
jgi:hypothetical protein